MGQAEEGVPQGSSFDGAVFAFRQSLYHPESPNVSSDNIFDHLVNINFAYLHSRDVEQINAEELRRILGGLAFEALSVAQHLQPDQENLENLQKIVISYLGENEPVTVADFPQPEQMSRPKGGQLRGERQAGQERAPQPRRARKSGKESSE